jgi:hypothetical protein
VMHRGQVGTGAYDANFASFAKKPYQSFAQQTIFCQEEYFWDFSHTPPFTSKA